MGYTSDLDGVGISVFDQAMAIKRFMSRLQNGQVTKIKLIGDSITEGVGATGHVSPPTNAGQVIFNNGAGTVFYEAAYTDNTWANLFRNYIQVNFPTVQFVNAGIGGKSSKWANANKQYWVSNSEDVTIVMLGTNDRWDCADTTEFKTNLEQFLDYVDARSNLMIVMSPPPAQSDSDTVTFHFGMKEVDRVITELCIAKNYIHISNYRNFLKIANEKKLPFNSILQDSSGSHPLDKGYTIIWQSIQQALGVIDDSMKWQDVTPTDIVRSSTFGINDPIRYYQVDKITIYLVAAGHPQIGLLPIASRGVLITYRSSEADAYSWQEYIVSDTSKRYIRYCNGNFDNSWNAWQNISTGAFSLIAGASISNTTAITSFTADSLTASLIGGSHPNIASFPEGLAGTLLTYRFTESEGFGYQEYSIYQTVKTYKRYWTGSAWGAWTKISAV